MEFHCMSYNDNKAHYFILFHHIYICEAHYVMKKSFWLLNVVATKNF